MGESSATARFVSRRAMLDKERALSTARNPGSSKYGNALVLNHTQLSRVHSAEVGKIDKQLKRSSMHMDQERKQFLQRYTKREPMLIVIRPPSPVMVKKYTEAQYDKDDDEYWRASSTPGYMKPLKSKDHVRVPRSTIDAFCVKTKKKVNLWEEAMLEREPPQFRSTVQPSWPLSPEEQEDLVFGLETHKQNLAAMAAKKEKIRAKRAKSALALEYPKKKDKKKKKELPAIMPGSVDVVKGEQHYDVDESEPSWQFITQNPGALPQTETVTIEELPAKPEATPTKSIIQPLKETQKTNTPPEPMKDKDNKSVDDSTSECRSESPVSSSSDESWDKLTVTIRPREHLPTGKGSSTKSNVTTSTVNPTITRTKASKTPSTKNKQNKKTPSDANKSWPKATSIQVVHNDKGNNNKAHGSTKKTAMKKQEHSKTKNNPSREQANHDILEDDENEETSRAGDNGTGKNGKAPRKKSGLEVILEAALESIDDN